MNYSFSADTNPIWSPFLGWIRMDGLLLPLCTSGEPLKVPSIYTWQRAKFPPFDTFCPGFPGHGGRASLTMRVFLSSELWKGVWAVWTKEASLNFVFLDIRQTPKIRIITFLRAGQYYMYWNTPNLKSGLFGAFPILHVRSRNFVDILLLIWSSAGIWRWNLAKICKTRQKPPYGLSVHSELRWKSA